MALGRRPKEETPKAEPPAEPKAPPTPGPLLTLALDGGATAYLFPRDVSAVVDEGKAGACAVYTRAGQRFAVAADAPTTCARWLAGLKS